jgi:hypothetical protein
LSIKRAIYLKRMEFPFSQEESQLPQAKQKPLRQVWAAESL